MDLVTRCPECGATFSASLAQLQLRKGYIRCPNCAHIFDGFDAVVPAADAKPETPAAAVPHVVRQRGQRAGSHTGAGRRAEPSLGMAQGRPGPEEPRISGLGAPTGRDAPFIAEPPQDAEDWADAGPVVSAPGGSRDDAYRLYVEPRTLETDGARDQPDFLEPEAEGHRGPGFYFWSILSVLGLVVLLAQCLYVYRVQIANQLPAVRPVLERACLALHCRIPYARDINQIAIMNSSLQARPASGAAAADASGQMVLQVTLRNNLDKPQEWPTLVLDLLDFSGTVVVKKDLPPASYLSGDALGHPFPAHAEAIASVPINMNDVKVSGFQLAKFFP